MSSNKRKNGKRDNQGSQSKKPKVILPLHLDEDSEVDLSFAQSKTGTRQAGNKKKTSTVATAPLADDFGEGDDDDDFADSLKESDQDEGHESETGNAADRTVQRKRRLAPAQYNRKRKAASPISSSESESSDDDIQDLAAKHLGKLTGALPDYDAFAYGESITTPIDAQIPSKIKRKIWENKYVDLAVLLPNTSYTNLKANRRFSLEIGQNSKISLVPNTYTKKITLIEQWTTAFLRFAAIYGIKFPKEMSKLMKYTEIVRDLANRRPGLSWLMYDIQFRCLRQSQHISWDQLHTEFWVMAATTSTFRSQRRQQPFQDGQSNNQPRPQFLRNTCWTYNRFGRCNNAGCHYEHKCGFCRGGHCAKSCQRGGPSRNGPDSQPQSSQTQTQKTNKPDARSRPQ